MQMSCEDLLNEIVLLKEENEKLRKELDETKQHLKKYTAPARTKTYYQNHKEEIIKKVKDYKEKTEYTVSKEKRKEYNRIAYKNRKEKMKGSNPSMENIEA